jgi:predicted lysophospholipase L1 biosynthesis ABC-type transport system permease subunit
MGIQVLEGRGFDEHDRADSPKVAVISDLAARTYWPNENPIGKRLSLEWNARVRGNMNDFIRACRKEISSLDPQQAGFAALRAEDMLFGSESRRRFQTVLLGGFALLAVFLAVIGIYGVAAYTVTQRAREVGIRLALGARPVDVVLLVLRQGMFTIIAGTLAGLAAAAALSKLMAGLLFGVSPSDASTFSGVLFLVLAIGVLSVYLPARSASKVDPAIVLSEE